MTKKNSILVTGGAGYVGSRVAEQLTKKGHNVRIIDKRKYKTSSKIEFVHGDIRDKQATNKALQNIDLVVHLAANIGPLTYMQNHQAEILEENSAIDSVLYPAMVENKIRKIVYSSSSMVFQHIEKQPYIEEDIDRINPPSNVYGFSKLIGEYFCKAFYEQYGINYVILRYHNIYGPGEDSKGSTPGDIHVIPALVEKVLSGQYPLEILGYPHSTRSFVYVDDAVEATVRLSEAALELNPQVINQDFNVGSSNAISILELAERIWKLLGDERPFKYKIVNSTANTAFRREMKGGKIKKAISWEPKMNLDEGIKVVAKWIKQKKVKSSSS